MLYYCPQAMKPIQVAVIGVGHLGSIHARIYSQLQSAQLVAVCDIAPDTARLLAQQYNCKAVTDYHELLGHVEAVSVAVPTHDHATIAEDFLSHDTHVLVEKPITSTLNQANRLLILSEKKKLVLQVGHVERFNSALRQVENQIKNPRFIEVHRLAPFQPRGTEVGVVLDLMIHDIDILLWLVKSPIRTIEAVGVKVLTPHEDIANARITFKNGAVANLTASRISLEAMRKFRIFQAGMDGVRPAAYVSMDLLSQSVNIYQHEGGRINHQALEISKEEPLKAELSAFLESIHHKRQPPVTAREAREALAVALQITRLVHRSHP